MKLQNQAKPQAETTSATTSAVAADTATTGTAAVPYLQSLIDARDLPPIPSRDEIVQILQEREFGFIPDIPYEISVSEPRLIREGLCAGEVEISQVTMTVTTEYGSHSFNVTRQLHAGAQAGTHGAAAQGAPCAGNPKAPATGYPYFVLLNFNPEVPNFYYPVEEIADRGFDVLSICYTDITADDGDFGDGLAPVLMPQGRPAGAPETVSCGTDASKTAPGKIALWAWAAIRVHDYARTLPGLDHNNSAIIGHSRLGKTALLAGMLDTRFKYVFSNDSGSSGASLARGSLGERKAIGPSGSTGESIDFITNMFPFWFCENYFDYRGTNYPTEFDQHFLLASIAPRYVYVASASMDDWADPESEFLACVAASHDDFRIICPDALPAPGDFFHEGHIGYHMRYGKHFLSRNDWNLYMNFIQKHLVK